MKHYVNFMTILDSVIAILSRSMPEPQAGLMAGMLFGVKASVDRALLLDLQTTGTIHLIALSGMNISILISCTQRVLLFMVKRPIANLVSALTIIGFIWVVGFSPSVVRAAIMGCISLLAVNLGKRNIPIISLILAVSCMLLLNPLWAGDISFQLSVASTLGIILFGPKGESTQLEQRAPIANEQSESVQQEAQGKQILARVAHLLWRSIQCDLQVSLAAQLCTIPIILLYFHRVSLIAPIVNILVGWLVWPIMVSGIVLVVIGSVWAPLGYVAGWIAWLFVTVLIEIVQLS